MIGLSFEGLNPFRLKMEFESTILDYASFYKLNLKQTKFIDSSLKSCDFSEADLAGAQFAGSNLMGATFVQSKLVNCDFRNAINYQINPSLNVIKGAKFSKDQIMGLLTSFGIKVE